MRQSAYTKDDHLRYVDNLSDDEFDCAMQTYITGPGGWYWRKNTVPDPPYINIISRDGPVVAKSMVQSKNSQNISNRSQNHLGHVMQPEQQTSNLGKLGPVLKTLKLCQNAIMAERTTFEALTAPPPNSTELPSLHPKNKWLLDMEESFLKLATVEEVSAGVFYCMNFVGDHYIYARYIESGMYLLYDYINNIECQG